MVFKKNAIEVGDRVVAIEDIKICEGTFTSGHRFKVVGSNDRGYALEDDDGNKCIEVPRWVIRKE